MASMNEKNIARAMYQQWRQLRTSTVEHRGLCECKDCSKRRQLGGKIELPYSGAPTDFRLKQSA